jgi:hypothetical protein
MSRCRSLVTTLRVAEKYDLDYLSSPAIAPLIGGAKVFYAEGYFLTHGTEIIVELGKKVAGAGKVQHLTHFLLPMTDFFSLGARVEPVCAVHPPLLRRPTLGGRALLRLHHR